MPVFFQQQINEHTRLGVWKIEENEDFFSRNVPVHRAVSHPRKRLQHLAGRFLLQYLFPDFPYQLIQIADTRKPYLPGEQFHFSISHCGDYAAAIVSRSNRVGVDIEMVSEKILSIKNKFLSTEEQERFFAMTGNPELQNLTLLWSAKEAVFKWYGAGNVDFRKHIRLEKIETGHESIQGQFVLSGNPVQLHYRLFDKMVLCWIVS